MASSSVIPAVEITDLRKTYSGGTVALRGISLSVRQGEFFGLLGPNGAGKTTAIGITTGLVNITSGSVKVMGHDVIADYRNARKKIGLAAQELNFDWFFSIEDLMMLQAGYYGVHKTVARENTDRLLKQFGLWEKRKEKARTLSGGMKRRFQIARSLVHDPEILILDEPTAGVDVELRRYLWGFLTKLNEDGKTIILTTHYIEEAEKLCERVAIIDNGKIVKSGTPRELMKGMHRDGLLLEVGEWCDTAGKALNGREYTCEDGTLKITTDQPELALAEIINILTDAGVVVKDVSITHATLEDVFIDLTGHTLND